MNARLYYDGRCALCRREMRWLQRLKSADLTLVDLHRAEVSLYQRQQMLRNLHLQFDDDSWAIGLEANVAAWSYTPLGFVFKPLLWPGIHRLAHRAYEYWAARRVDRCDWIADEADEGKAYGK